MLKERGGRNRAIATGVRRAESVARSKRGIYEDYNSDKKKKIILNNDNDDKRRWFERCQKQAKTIINPIVDWNDENIKDYIQSEKIDLNPLYCEGFKRVGCVGCPMAGKHRYVEFRRYPTYKKAYIHAFDRMLSARIANEKDKTKWQTGYDVFRWWLEEDYRQYEIGEEFYQSEE